MQGVAQILIGNPEIEKALADIKVSALDLLYTVFFIRNSQKLLRPKVLRTNLSLKFLIL